MCLNLVVLPILLRVLPFSIYVTQALFTGVMVVCSYVSHKYFSFGTDRKRRLMESAGEVSSAAIKASEASHEERTP
jgi:putative flippase GtrA